MIDLYTWATPNGRKISIALEEMELPYVVQKVDIRNDEQFEPHFLGISPNNKIPAIVDHDNGAYVFESGAILMYLADKSGQFLPTEIRERTKILSWLAWQTSGLGPTLGQLNYFVNRADEEVPHAIERFSDETVRLFTVLDKQLAENDFVAGAYSIADMAIYPWSSASYDTIKARTGISFPSVEGWHDTVGARSGVKLGMTDPNV